METRTIRFIRYGTSVTLILGLLAIIALVISGIDSRNNRAIAWFFSALLPYLFLVNKVNKHRSKLLFSKNNLALVNTVGALSLLAFYVMHFWNPFKPVSQILFDWPALVGFIFLGLASYGGQKERIHHYARRIKFWKKSFWRRQFHKSFYRVITKLLPKTGLILIALGIATQIMNSGLNPEHQINGLNSFSLILIFLGVFIWFFTFFSIINFICISDTAKETGKTYEEVEREMMLAANKNPFLGNSNSIF